MVMELLEQLEQRINTLLQQNSAQQQEISRLQNAQISAEAALAETETLREQLVQEQQKNKAALTRIESILDRLKERTHE
jgi:cell division septum initiation protein DivIVA